MFVNYVFASEEADQSFDSKFGIKMDDVKELLFF